MKIIRLTILSLICIITFNVGLTGCGITKDTSEISENSSSTNKSDGNKGNVKLVFKSKDEIEATIQYTNKLEVYDDLSLDGTFLFKPYNLKDIEAFYPFEDQSFIVDLNSWGIVRFVSGKVIGERRIPLVFFLTNRDGDILYDLGAPFPNDVKVKAVSFQDVNKDGLKDIIIIIIDKDSNDTSSNASDDSLAHIVKVFFQNADGSFEVDPELTKELNEFYNMKDIKTVTDFLSNKF